VTNLVPPDRIERIVGMTRDPELHWARAVSAEEIVYILHSQACKDAIDDLRYCAFSLALDRGIDVAEWVEDQPLVVTIYNGRLVPQFAGRCDY
jgi:hypothetical protein